MFEIFPNVYFVLEVVLRSESLVKAEKKLKIISTFKIDFLRRPNGKDWKSFQTVPITGLGTFSLDFPSF